MIPAETTPRVAYLGLGNMGQVSSIERCVPVVATVTNNRIPGYVR